MSYQPAKLDDSKVNELQNLESELGKTVVAVEPHPQPATMSPDQLDKLKRAEENLGVVLVAYDR